MRGLKYANNGGLVTQQFVAPHMGAWIEMLDEIPVQHVEEVAPHMGAWIEMKSPQSRYKSPSVAPHMGAWIEIKHDWAYLLTEKCRTPHGCVD